ncbi:glycoside hydrolase family 13 protein [Mycena pura]|uniref:alpha-amylase n=1 Tax=Mycena pura TaxID=153505 RepID=A0AAD6Y458_9AGAR|nr:glycoside hydrolase family 13 protein [Mycena pura]
MPSFAITLFSLLLASPALAASAEDWSTRSIYQLVTDRFATSNDSSTPCDTSRRTFCGGSWSGIGNHLDYIQEMGFDAIWISPVATNVERTAYGDGYHGYWSRDIDTISPHFGTPDDLKALSAAVHKRGMFLMLDVVVNHYAGIPTNTTASGGFTFDYASFVPLGTQADFHSQCFISDYANQTDVEQCWLGDENLPLPDVNTEDPAVVATMNQWIKGLVANFSADGVRIDTVKHIRHDFWSGFTASAGVFTLGEVLTYDAKYAASYLDAVDAVLEYPAFYGLNTAFGSPYLSALLNSPSLASLAPANVSSSPALSAAFLENHDQPRFPSYTSDLALIKNAMVWPFVGDGIPILYYGQEQGYQGDGDPSNREALWLSGYETNKPLVAHVTALNAARKLAIARNASFLTGRAYWIPQPNLSSLMLAKPPLLALLTNAGANASVQPTWNIPAGQYAPNTTLVDVLACVPVVLDGAGPGGATVVRAQAGRPQVLVPASMLRAGGGACPARAAGGSGAAAWVRGGRGMLAVVGAVLAVFALV